MEHIKTLKPKVTSFEEQPASQVQLLEKWIVSFRILIKAIAVAYKRTRSIKKVWQVIKAMIAMRKEILGEKQSKKLFKIDRRYYWRLNTPGFPSEAATQMFHNEVNRIITNNQIKGLRILFLAITNKCPLRCEHCFEWENLNKKEALTYENLEAIVHKFQDFGTTQIILSGGGPLIRFKDLIKLLENKKEGTDFWVVTSGLRLSIEKAYCLKKAGLTGVMVSLDHWEEEKHNQFRGYENAYHDAINAVINAKAAGMVTALSICLTNEFISTYNLKQYLELAKKLGVAFVQFLEPKALGRFEGQQVALTPSNLQLLEVFYETYNSDPLYKDFPTIEYIHNIQRRVGCLGNGDHYLYVDTYGNIQMCPFCRSNTVSALAFPVKDIIELMSLQSCKAFISPKLNINAIFLLFAAYPIPQNFLPLHPDLFNPVFHILFI